jgi:hypothetical protein
VSLLLACWQLTRVNFLLAVYRALSFPAGYWLPMLVLVA